MGIFFASWPFQKQWLSTFVIAILYNAIWDVATIVNVVVVGDGHFFAMVIFPNLKIFEGYFSSKFPRKTFHIDSSLFQIEVSFDIHKIKYSEFLDQQLNVEEDMTTAKSHLDTAIPDLVRELGYTFTSNTEQCRQNLLQLCGGPKVSAATVARIIGIMVRTHTGLDDPATLQNLNATGTSIWDKKDSNEPKTWNVEVFIKAVHELHPTLNWKEIIDELDHPGFAIKDRVGLIVLINALKLGFKVQGFQVIGIFTSKHWKTVYLKPFKMEIVCLTKTNIYFSS